MQWDGKAKIIGGSKIFLSNYTCINWPSQNGLEYGDKRWDELLAIVS
jgi:hypothetical protein